MTAYKKVGWKDHIVDADTQEVIQEGTPLSQANFNHMDDEIERLGLEKADKSINIGYSESTKLIGEILNYSISNTFTLEAMLHNLFQTNFSQLNNAFLSVGKYSNTSLIEGKLHILMDTVTSYPSGYYKTKIQITDTGKIYAINEKYMNYTNWTILNKSNNVIIYDNPKAASIIDGNVIWDSDLNKTNIATIDRIDNLWSGSVSGNGASIAITNSINKYKKLVFTIKKTGDWECICSVYPKSSEKFVWGEYGYINNPFGFLQYAAGADGIAFQLIPTGCEIIKVVGVYN